MARYHRIENPNVPTLAHSENLRTFEKEVKTGRLTVMIAKEGGFEHLSIAHSTTVAGPDGKHDHGRYPTWDEIKEARYRFMDHSINVAMLLPGKGEPLCRFTNTSSFVSFS